MTEIVCRGMISNIGKAVDEVIAWSQYNHMNINWNKTKEMIIGTIHDQIEEPLHLDGHAVQRIDSYKLLGILVDANLRWHKHVEFVCSKASQRLHYLKLLKRCGPSKDDLLYFYCTVIRSVLEYACPAWHTSLTEDESNLIECVQKRALAIIFGYEDYYALCDRMSVLTLQNRRENLYLNFCRKLFDSSSCLNYLLPMTKSNIEIHTLRQHSKYEIPFARTERFRKSFLVYALRNFY